MAKKFPMKGAGVAGSTGSKYTSITHKTTSPSGGGTGPEDGGYSIASDGQGRSDSTLMGSKVFRTKPSGDSGAKGGVEKSAGVSGKSRTYEKNLAGGTIYRNSKPSKRK